MPESFVSRSTSCYCASVGFFPNPPELIPTPSFERTFEGVRRGGPLQIGCINRLCETAGYQLAGGACLHFDACFFFERLDQGGGVFCSEAEGNSRGEILFHNVQRRNR